MKITFLVGVFPSLSETFILNQITHFAKEHDVRILSFNKPSLKSTPPTVEKYELLKKTAYLNKTKSKLWRRVYASVQIVLHFFHYPKLVWKLLNKLVVESDSFLYPELFLALRCMSDPPDVVISHFGPIGVRSLILKEVGFKTKLATVFHGYDLSRYLTANGPNVYKQLFDKGDIFLPISEFWKEKLIGLGCPREKISVHHMGIELDKFPFRKREYIKTKPFRCLTVSRLVEKKGHIYALEAVSKLVSENQKIVYEIGGDGPLREYLEQKARDFNIEANVIFHGAVQHAKVVQLMDAANCFLLPSVTANDGDMEGIPVVLMEAMASGLPVLSTFHSGIPELIENKQNGVVVPEKDSHAIKDALFEMIHNYEDFLRLAGNGRKTIESSFSVNKLNSRLCQIISDSEK